MKRQFFAVLVLVLGTTTQVDAGDYDDGLAAYNAGDYATALRLWRPFAEQGYADAQFNLGYMHANGIGFPQDYAEALKWYRKAAEWGDTAAQFNLGLMYDKGRGVPQDYAEAVKWYRKAAEQGDGSAQINLGFMYSEGRGVPQDYVQAHMWYNLAASRLPPGVFRDMSVLSRDILAEKMTPAQIAEAQRLAREWRPKKEGK